MSKDSSFKEYRKEIPQRERDNLAEMVEDIDTSDYKDVAAKARVLLASLLRGHLHPDVSKEGRALLELELVSLAAADPRKQQNQVGVGGGANVLINVLQDASRGIEQISAPEPKYITATPQLPEVLPDELPEVPVVQPVKAVGDE